MKRFWRWLCKKFWESNDPLGTPHDLRRTVYPEDYQ